MEMDRLKLILDHIEKELKNKHFEKTCMELTQTEVQLGVLNLQLERMIRALQLIANKEK